MYIKILKMQFCLIPFPNPLCKNCEGSHSQNTDTTNSNSKSLKFLPVLNLFTTHFACDWEELSKTIPIWI